MAEKKIKTCNRCGETGLAWGKTPEGFKLYKGKEVGGKWQPDMSLPHNCGGEKKDSETTPGDDRVVWIGCRCGFALRAEKAALLKFGYPIASCCEEFMVVMDAPPKAAELTPDTVTV
jgi:hypothetical protein